MEEQILNGLRELSTTTFPRRCSKCGRVFYSFDEFVHETKRLNGSSGLMENRGCPEDGDAPIVELYRNCVCGSTLMEFFNNRRDTSWNGQRRRAIFGKLVEGLVVNGLSRDEARKELLQVMHFNKSPLLESMGFQIEFK
jgi:hypothetical protein